jgi:hypothetical protein
MEAVRTSETSVDNHFTRQYIPEDNSEHHTRRRENLKSHMYLVVSRFASWPTCLPASNRTYAIFSIVSPTILTSSAGARS